MFVVSVIVVVSLSLSDGACVGEVGVLLGGGVAPPPPPPVIGSGLLVGEGEVGVSVGCGVVTCGLPVGTYGSSVGDIVGVCGAYVGLVGYGVGRCGVFVGCAAVGTVPITPVFVFVGRSVGLTVGSEGIPVGDIVGVSSIVGDFVDPPVAGVGE